METQVLKQTIHELIEKINDKELLNLYLQLLKRETKREGSDDLFSTTDEGLVNRAKASVKSVEAGKTRNIREFKKEIEEWKKEKTSR